MYRILKERFLVHEYALAPDRGVPMISLFLNSLDESGARNDGDVTAHSAAVGDFCSYLRTRGDGDRVGLEGIMDLLAEYESEEGVPKEVNYARQGAANHFRCKSKLFLPKKTKCPKLLHLARSLLATSESGRVFSFAAEFPSFFRLCPLLFPRKAMAMAGETNKSGGEAEDERERRRRYDVLAAMNELAEREPWQLGFGTVSEKA